MKMNTEREDLRKEETSLRVNIRNKICSKEEGGY